MRLEKENCNLREQLIEARELRQSETAKLAKELASATQALLDLKAEFSSERSSAAREKFKMQEVSRLH